MKKPLSFLLLTLLATTAHAQVPLTFGVKAGVNSNKLINSYSSVTEQNARLGLMGGAFLRVGGSFYVQPEVLFGQKGGEALPEINLGNGIPAAVRRINTLDVPVLLGKSFGVPLAPVKFRLNAGPILSFPLWAKQDGLNYRDRLNTATLGYQAGVGLDVLRLTLDVRYEGSLSKMGADSYTVNGYTFRTDDRVSLFQFALGYKLTSP